MNKNHKKRRSVLLLYTLLLTLVIPFSLMRSHTAQADRFTLSTSQEQAQTVGDSTRLKGRKLSPELESKLSDPTLSQDSIRTIVQVNDPESASLKQVLKRNGVRVHKKLKNLQMLDVELPAAAIQDLADSDDVQFISADKPVEAMGHLTATTGADLVRHLPGLPVLDGTNVTLAILDSGLDDTHKAFQANKGRIKAKANFTSEGAPADTMDHYGHGTHVTGLAAADDDPTGNAYGGIASNANLVILKVLDSHGVGTISGLLNALNWVLTNQNLYKIRVINMSLGTPAVASYVNDPLCLAVRRLVDAGIVVVAAAGNDGKDDASGQEIYGRIHSPGIEPSAITVGCANSFGTDSRADDAIATYSSRGPTRSYSTDSDGTIHYDNLVKPDLVAPGNQVIQAEANDNYLVDNYPQLETNLYRPNNMKEMYLSGTSMASPQVAGAAILMLQANPSLTPNMVKAILMYTAQPLAGYNLLEQGAGELNIEGAIRLARLVRTDLTAQTALGSQLLTSATPPVPQTTIAGGTFTWAQGVTGDYSFITGTDLITKYQIIFAQGHLLSNAILLSNGHLLSNSTQVTNGVTVANSIMTSDGNPLGNGSLFLDSALLLSNGTLLSDGHLLSNGVLMSDGHLLSNSIQSLSVLVNGDRSAHMK